MSHLWIHLGLMGLMVILLITLFRVCNSIGWPAMLTISVCGTGMFVASVNLLRGHFEGESLRSDIITATRGHHSIIIRGQKYRLERIPEDDPDDDEPEDSNPEIPI